MINDKSKNKQQKQTRQTESQVIHSYKIVHVVVQGACVQRNRIAMERRLMQGQRGRVGQKRELDEWRGRSDWLEWMIRKWNLDHENG